MRRLAYTLLICGLLPALLGAPAPSAGAQPGRALSAGHTYIVNSTLDEPDTDPLNPNCVSTPSGQCTLRAAVMESNIATGPNTIILPAGTYVLTRPGYEDNALLGDLDISHDLTIQGAGSGATIVDGNGSVTRDRVFKILNTAQNVTFSGLTIQNGQSLSSTVGVIGGGGLYMEGAGHLLLSDVIFEGNTGETGGGLYADFSSQGGSIEMDHVILRANRAIAVGSGGGAFVHLLSSLSEVDVRDSQVYSNTTDQGGGGFYVYGSTLAHWRIERSEIYSNTAAGGGGIASYIPLALFDSQLHDNQATYNSGAIEAESPLVISRTTLAANTAGRRGGGIGSINFVNIVESTLSGNSAQDGGGIYYRGHIYGGVLSLTNSTLSGNGASRDGGGIYVDGSQAELFNTTIASNRARLSWPQPGIGGGLYITASATLTVENTIIANNTHRDVLSTPVPDDCYGPLVSLGHNLIRTTSNCNIAGDTGTNKTGQDPLLGPLQNNGGSTQTHALLPSSPAIDGGAPAGCTDAAGAPITNDQRGAPRPAFGDPDPTCDMGAYEVVPEADLSVGQRDSADPVRLGVPLTYTVVITNNGPSPATGVFLTDTLPVSATLNTAAASQGSCLGPVTVICNLGPLASGANITVTVSVTPTAAGMITNTVTVTANEFDPVLANNTASEPTVVLHQIYLPLIQR